MKKDHFLNFVTEYIEMIKVSNGEIIFDDPLTSKDATVKIIFLLWKQFIISCYTAEKIYAHSFHLVSTLSKLDFL